MGLEHRLVAAQRECPGDLVTPVSAYLRLKGRGARFLLESVEGGERSSRFSILGLGSLSRIWADSTGTLARDQLGIVTRLAGPERDPLDEALRFIHSWTVEEDFPLPPCAGGLVGTVAYDYARRLERLGSPPPGAALPDVLFEFVSEVVVFDHLRHELQITVLAEEQDRSRVRDRLDEIEAALVCADPDERVPSKRPRLHATMSDQAYCAGVERLLAHIRDGDIFQAVLSKETDVQDSPPLFGVYRALRRVNPSPYMFYLDLGDVVVAGSSPESAVRMNDGQVRLRPIAGTRRRGATESEDQSLEQELRESRKERAEHAMLVDLARNDLSRVAVPGSVRVRELAQVERFSHVMHLVSDVEGTVPNGFSPADVIRATFPVGTVSGAPKIRAMQLIDDYEASRRNLYGGCLGYIGRNGDMDMALVIRSAVRAGGRTTIRAGAGVVAGSTPEGELAECRSKLEAMRTAIHMAAGCQQEESEAGEVVEVSRGAEETRS